MQYDIFFTVETVFSFMFNSWRKDRNKMLLNTVEVDELMIKINFNTTSNEFDFLKSNDGHVV